MAELKHLRSGWDVDRFIVLEKAKLVAIRFSAYEVGVRAGRGEQQHVQDTMIMDATLTSVAPLVREWCTVYAVDINEVPEFNQMYELTDGSPFALMFFFNNEHIKVDARTGNNNKINFAIDNRDDLIGLLEEVYVAAKKGQKITTSTKRFAGY